MTRKQVMVISPPFYSHLNPMMAMATGFLEIGCQVTVACSKAFEAQIVAKGMTFHELDISGNSNTGTAEISKQSDEAEDRLEAFFHATREGAVATLMTQTQHRQKDMFHDPDTMIKKLEDIKTGGGVDLFMVDILSYNVILALHLLSLPYILFCPPHPKTLPRDKNLYGLPPVWPKAIQVDQGALDQLKVLAGEVEKELTQAFNEKIHDYGSKVSLVDNAFKVISPKGVIYNYVDFDLKEEALSEHKAYFIGHAFEEESLEEVWLERVHNNRKKILITLGTFLSNRVDVLQKLIIGCKDKYPECQLFVAGGRHVDGLEPFCQASDYVAAFLPQKGLLPYMDLVIHHGGNNSFTESLYYGKAMIVLPFSSDQFNVAYDVERHNLGHVLDPNHFSREDLTKALDKVSQGTDVEVWSRVARNMNVTQVAQQVMA